MPRWGPGPDLVEGQRGFDEGGADGEGTDMALASAEIDWANARRPNLVML